MSIDIFRIRREMRKQWKRRTRAKPCDDSAEWESAADSPTNACMMASDLTGALFDCDGWPRSVPPDVCDHLGCAEALIAQWEGLVPPVRMPGNGGDNEG